MDDLVKNFWAPARLEDFIDFEGESAVGGPIASFGIGNVAGL